MLHGLYISVNGTATYTNKYLRTGQYLIEKTTGSSVTAGIGHIIGEGRRKFLESLMLRPAHQILFGRSILSNANTNLFYHNNRLMATVEMDIPFQIHAPSLHSIGEYDFDGWLVNDPRIHSFSAHPKICPRTGQAIFFSMSHFFF